MAGELRERIAYALEPFMDRYAQGPVAYVAADIVLALVAAEREGGRAAPDKKSTEQLERVVRGALKSTTEAHPYSTEAWVTGGTKRVLGAIRPLLAEVDRLTFNLKWATAHVSGKCGLDVESDMRALMAIVAAAIAWREDHLYPPSRTSPDWNLYVAVDALTTAQKDQCRA